MEGGFEARDLSLWWRAALPDETASGGHIKTDSQTAGRLHTSIFKVNVIELRPSCGRAFAQNDGFKDCLSKNKKTTQIRISEVDDTSSSLSGLSLCFSPAVNMQFCCQHTMWDCHIVHWSFSSCRAKFLLHFWCNRQKNLPFFAPLLSDKREITPHPLAPPPPFLVTYYAEF